MNISSTTSTNIDHFNKNSITRMLSLTLAIGSYGIINKRAYAAIICPENSTLTVNSSETFTETCDLDSASSLTITGSLYNESTLNNSGTIINYNRTYNQISGILNNNTGGSLTNNYGLYNDGEINNTGEIANDGGLYNYDGGLLNNNTGGSLTNSYFLSNYGSLNNDGNITNDGGLYNYGTANNTGDITNDNSLYNAEGGILNNNTGGSLTNQDLLTNFGTLNNTGEITSDGDLYNYGNLNNKASGSLTNSYFLVNYGTVNNSGEIINDGGIINEDDSILNNNAGGSLTNNISLYNYGSLNNTGEIINDGGLYNYGNLNNNTGGSLTNNWDLINHTTLNNSGTLTNEKNSILDNYGSINNSGELINNSVGDSAYGIYAGLYNNRSLSNETGGTLTNNGILSNIGTINNSGSFEVTAGGEVNEFVADPNPQITHQGSFIQSEGSTIINGSMSQNSIVFNGGTLSGSGTLTSANAILLGEDASINPGNSPGTLNINADLDLFGTLTAEFLSPSSYDILNVNGVVTFASSTMFDFTFDSNFMPTDGLELDFLFASGGFANFDMVNYSLAGISGFSWDVFFDDVDSALSLRFTQVTNTVPEPAPILLFGLSLPLMAWATRKRRTKLAA
ncbi:PEP-CTERM sorting domain-containing protein [Alteromonadaceae bacterium BrNp21-10]|nr:PEP-CTERM sorting domain-containing protein [Alteromonadaceae bacterium BrNp21-10]